MLVMSQCGLCTGCTYEEMGRSALLLTINFILVLQLCALLLPAKGRWGPVATLRDQNQRCPTLTPVENRAN